MLRSERGVVEWHHVRAAPRVTSAKSRKRSTYKQRVRSKVFHLTFDIAALRQEIQDLHALRELLYTRALYTRFDPNGSLVHKTRALNQLTKPGVSLDDPVILYQVAQFLAPDLQFGDLFSGLDQLRVSWREFARRLRPHAGVQTDFCVVAFDASEGTCTVRFNSRTYGTITVGALETFFPSVLNDKPLTNALLGKPVELPSLVHIVYNAADQVVRYDVEFDLVGTLLRLTADARKTGKLLEQATRDKVGMQYVLSEYETTNTPPSVERVWAVDRQVESEPEPSPRSSDRYAVAFLLS